MKMRVLQKEIALLCLGLLSSVGWGFGLPTTATASSRTGLWGLWSLMASVSTDSDITATNGSSALNSKDLPSWEDLESMLPQGDEPKPLVTLYRDTNGWCPFCERVWIALRLKGIPYDECLISLQNKPEWYKQLVPTTLVPAVLFHESADETDDSSSGTSSSSQRTIVWESQAIMEALDERFPDTPQLMHLDQTDFQEAMEQNSALSTAGVKFVYGGRNQTLSEEEKDQRRQDFEQALDELDGSLASKGPFRLGSQVSGVDVLMMPTLERWRHQLPLTTADGLDILKGRPHLQAWFEAMDALEPYADRVMGDAYSWTATASMFLRYFGGGEDRPEVAQGIQRADAAAARLSESFTKYEGGATPYAVEEATRKLISNHQAVIQDCTLAEGLSQKTMPRASSTAVADVVLRHVTNVLLESIDDETSSAMAVARSAPLPEGAESGTEAALVARTVAARLCVPRDMGAPAAATLRAVLSILADRWEAHEQS